VDSVLELIHGDLYGPIAPATPNGNKYFLLPVDDLSHFMWIRVLSSKDQAPSVIKNFQAAVEVETGKKLKVLWIDRGEGVGGVCSTPCRARRTMTAHRLILTTAKWGGGVAQPEHCWDSSMRAEVEGASRLFFGEAVTTAVHVLERSPTRVINGKTP
jgi:hypothetical protein